MLRCCHWRVLRVDLSALNGGPSPIDLTAGPRQSIGEVAFPSVPDTEPGASSDRVDGAIPTLPDDAVGALPTVRGSRASAQPKQATRISVAPSDAAADAEPVRKASTRSSKQRQEDANRRLSAGQAAPTTRASKESAGFRSSTTSTGKRPSRQSAYASGRGESADTAKSQATSPADSTQPAAAVARQSTQSKRTSKQVAGFRSSAANPTNSTQSPPPSTANPTNSTAADSTAVIAPQAPGAAEDLAGPIPALPRTPDMDRKDLPGNPPPLLDDSTSVDTAKSPSSPHVSMPSRATFAPETVIDIVPAATQIMDFGGSFEPEYEVGDHMSPRLSEMPAFPLAIPRLSELPGPTVIDVDVDYDDADATALAIQDDDENKDTTNYIAFGPVHIAKNHLQKSVGSMKKMKTQNIDAMYGIERNYKAIEAAVKQRYERFIAKIKQEAKHREQVLVVGLKQFEALVKRLKATTNTKITALTAERNRLQLSSSDNKEQIAELEEDVLELDTTKEDAEKELETLKEELAQLKKTHEEYNAKIVALEADMGERPTQEKFSELEAALAERPTKEKFEELQASIDGRPTKEAYEALQKDLAERPTKEKLSELEAALAARPVVEVPAGHAATQSEGGTKAVAVPVPVPVPVPTVLAAGAPAKEDVDTSASSGEYIEVADGAVALEEKVAVVASEAPVPLSDDDVSEQLTAIVKAHYPAEDAEQLLPSEWEDLVAVHNKYYEQVARCWELVSAALKEEYAEDEHDTDSFLALVGGIYRVRTPGGCRT